jgi:hypothetical protein
VYEEPQTESLPPIKTLGVDVLPKNHPFRTPIWEYLKIRAESDHLFSPVIHNRCRSNHQKGSPYVLVLDEMPMS